MKHCTVYLAFSLLQVHTVHVHQIVCYRHIAITCILELFTNTKYYILIFGKDGNVLYCFSEMAKLADICQTQYH